MNSYEHTIIRAVIPHPENPDIYLRSPSGEFPAHLHESGDGTYEVGLRMLGKKVIGCIDLSVNQRLKGPVGEIIYHTKPLDFTPDPDDLFQWR
jgi:hypothetical protein